MGQSRSFLGNVSLTTAAEILSLLSSTAVISLLGWWLGPAALAEYLLLRRLTVWFLSGSRAGLATALPRYIARSTADKTGSCESGGYFLGGAVVITLSSIALAAVFLADSKFFAAWLFGSGNRGSLVLALVLLLVGQAAYMVIYCYHVGLLDMVRANLICVWNLAIVPVAVVAALARTHSIALIVGTIGVVTTVSSVLFAIPVFRRLKMISVSRLPARIVELLQYGIPRVPADFGNAALLAAGPVVAAHFIPMDQLAPLLLGMTILAVVSYGSNPIRTVLLSQVSMMLEKGAVERVRGNLETLAAAVPEIAAFICIQLFIFADVVVRIWVGPHFSNDVIVIRLLILAIPPYMFFTTLRSTIDAAVVKAHNTSNILIGLVVYIALLALTVKTLPTRWLPEEVAVSLLAALVVLGILTARTFCRLYGASIPWKRSLPPILVAGALGGISLLFRSLSGPVVRPFHVVALEACLGLAYLTTLALFGSGWVRYTWQTALRELHG